eukprot:scaffold3103_cov136-Cylindrotheca_fusiformis.AAC.14
MLHRTAMAMSTESVSAKKGALIFLHGLGDSPAGWSQLKEILPSFHSRLSEIEYVFPAAPQIPITINGGMIMPGWFDLYDWPIGVGSKDDRDGLLGGVKTIEDHVEKLQKEHGIPRSRIVVGGFSQGGAVALLAAYRNTNEAYAGCAGLSAWLTLPEALDVSQQAKQTPLFWGHGRLDDKVLFPQQKFGVDKLRQEGVNVEDKEYDMGHSSHPDEMKDFADFVDSCLFNDEANEL